MAVEQSKRVRKKGPARNEPLLLGVTGGIATGKTTVALALEELGAKTIDFDVLSRDVMLPGMPAWEDISEYFGPEVLLNDRTLDRKRIAEIVFHDPAKRKKLEEFTHARIFAQFTKRAGEFAAQDPTAVIQAVIPLLFEADLQGFFHKILLVYTSERIQIERLINRDGISGEMARNILRAQMSIEEKRKYADYTVDNSGSLEEIRAQVARIWGELKVFRDSL